MKKSISKRQVNNPFTQIEDYNCFGCSPKNEFGLHLEFYEEGDEIVCEWQPKAQLQTRFLSPVYTNKGKVTLRATLKEQIRRKTHIDVKLYDNEENLCAEGDIGYLVFPEKFAIEKLYYPDFDSFLED